MGIPFDRKRSLLFPTTFSTLFQQPASITFEKNFFFLLLFLPPDTRERRKWNMLLFVWKREEDLLRMGFPSNSKFIFLKKKVFLLASSKWLEMKGRRRRRKKKNVSETKITYDEICIPFSNDYYIDWDRKGIETVRNNIIIYLLDDFFNRGKIQFQSKKLEYYKFMYERNKVCVYIEFNR